MALRMSWRPALSLLVIHLAAAAQIVSQQGQPHDPQALDRIEKLIAAGDLQEAQAALEALDSAQRRSARALLLEAMALHRAGELLPSLEATQLSLEKDPRNAAAHKLFGLNVARLGKPELAEPYFRQATLLAPADPQGWYYLGVNHVELSRLEEARQELERALQLKPDWIDAMCALGLAHELLAEFAEAERLYREAAAVRDRSTVGPTTPYLYLSRLLSSQDRSEESVEATAKAIQASPEGVEEWYEHGRVLVRAGKFEAALKALDRAIALDPHDERPHYQRMLALKALGRATEAREAGRAFARLRRQRGSTQADSSRLP